VACWTLANILSDLTLFRHSHSKTTTVVELIQQAVLRRGYKVLVAAPSNVAVDNVLAKLVVVDASVNGNSNHNNKRKSQNNKLRVVRLGHPARLQAKILPYSLEALVQQADGTDIVSDVRQELGSYLKIATNTKSRSSDKRLAYKEIKALRKEVRTREEKVVQELLNNAQVVLATCVGAGNRLLRELNFDLVVIDEAAQALEAACWIPALRGAKLVLAGDHCQLPPTIKSRNPEVEKGLSQTMFERLMALYGDIDCPAAAAKEGRISRMLQVQYRMHETISDWASAAMYHGKLQTHESVKQRTLSQLTGKSDDDGVAQVALLLIDTAGCQMYESVNAAGSRFNVGEAELVARQVRLLVSEVGVQQEEIAVITPYNGQVEILRTALLPDFPKLEIRSVDGFQGGEREAVVLSLVRSSERGGRDGIGFLKNERRLNVA
jgi:superfamily I DNA and/or RNA helicase